MIANLSTIDFIIVLAYFGVVFYIARWATLRRKHSHSDTASADYFLSGKSEGWIVIGAALFASNIGSEIILGLAGSGARADMPNAQFEILASLVLIILGWVFVPFYLKTGVYTMPQFLEMRYSPAARTYLSVVSILAYVLTKISLIIFSGALIFDMFGIPFWTGAIIIVLSTGLYTVLGGLTAVIYTDVIQTVILLAGTIAVTFYGLHELGGWDEMTNTIAVASAEPGNPSVSQFFNLWRPLSDTNYPWTGMLFGAPILGVWYWCTDQFIVQKVLSAKDISQARKGTLFAGFLKLLPVFIFLMPGIILFIVLGLLPSLLVVALLKKPTSRFAERINFFQDMHWTWSFSIYIAFALIIWIQVETIYIQGVGWLQTFYMLYAIPLIFVAVLPQVRSFYKKQ